VLSGLTYYLTGITSFVFALLVIYNFVRFFTIQIVNATEIVFEKGSNELVSYQRDRFSLADVSSISINSFHESSWKLFKINILKNRSNRRSSESDRVFWGIISLIAESILYFCRTILHIFRPAAVYYTFDIVYSDGDAMGFMSQRGYTALPFEEIANDLENEWGFKVTYSAEIKKVGYTEFISNIK
ncbi:MAG: hypothetical protein IH840_12735, partial [Candidatus Heimdallarchaeota archaeon]|nr:hypothetical protein [Candidatus Heimdallarchaeota archaeon]